MEMKNLAAGIAISLLMLLYLQGEVYAFARGSGLTGCSLYINNGNLGRCNADSGEIVKNPVIMHLNNHLNIMVSDCFSDPMIKNMLIVDENGKYEYTINNFYGELTGEYKIKFPDILQIRTDGKPALKNPPGEDDIRTYKITLKTTDKNGKVHRCSIPVRIKNDLDPIDSISVIGTDKEKEIIAKYTLLGWAMTKPNMHIEWDFGDGTAKSFDYTSISKSFSVRHEYKKGGKYVIKLTVSLGDKEYSQNYEIEIGSDSQAVIKAKPHGLLNFFKKTVKSLSSADPALLKVKRGTTVDFDASGSYIEDSEVDSYEWDFDATDPEETNGIDSTKEKARYKYSSDGTFYVTLQANQKCKS